MNAKRWVVVWGIVFTGAAVSVARSGSVIPALVSLAAMAVSGLLVLGNLRRL